MATRPVEFHPDAVDEAVAAREWYQARNLSAAAAFLEETDRAIERIAEAPQRFPQHVHGTRRYLLHRFPFSIIYRETDTTVQIVAVAHARRKPGYWTHR